MTRISAKVIMYGKRSKRMPGFISKHRKCCPFLSSFICLFGWSRSSKSGPVFVHGKTVWPYRGCRRIILWPFNTVVSIGKGYVFSWGQRRITMTLRENDRSARTFGHDTVMIENERLREP